MDDIPRISSFMRKPFNIYVFWLFESATDLLLSLALISKGLLHCINNQQVKETKSVVSFFKGID